MDITGFNTPNTPAELGRSATTQRSADTVASLVQPDPAAEAPERERIQAAVADMQDYIQSAQRNLQFQLDEGGEHMVVTVTEASSGKVIRQIPSEEALRLADNLSEIRSALFSGKV